MIFEFNALRCGAIARFCLWPKGHATSNRISQALRLLGLL